MYKAMVAILVTFASASFAAASNAAEYPDRHVRVIVPFPAGTAADTAARIVLDKMSADLHTPFLTINRPGAIGTIGTTDVVRSAGDGYTIGYLADGQVTTVTAAYAAQGKVAPYDPLADLVPISMSIRFDFALVVRKDLPVRSMDEFVAYARAHPGKLNIASGNPTGRLGIALLNSIPGVAVQEIPNKDGEPGCHRDIQSGIVDAMFSTVTTAKPFIDAGHERAIGVIGEEKSEFLPDTETLASQGYAEFKNLRAWFALFAPKGTSPSHVEILSRAHSEALRDSAVREKLHKMHLAVQEGSAEYVTRTIAEGNAFLTRLIRERDVSIIGK